MKKTFNNTINGWLDYSVALNHAGFRNVRRSLLFPSPYIAVKGYKEYSDLVNADKKNDIENDNKCKVNEEPFVPLKKVERKTRKGKKTKKYKDITSMASSDKDNNNNNNSEGSGCSNVDLTQLTPKEVERLVLYNVNDEARYLDETYSSIKEAKNVVFNSDPWKVVILGTWGNMLKIKNTLISILSGFDEDGAYVILIVVRQQNGLFKTLVKQILAMCYTDVGSILDIINKRMDILTLKYSITTGDLVACRVRRLRLISTLRKPEYKVDEGLLEDKLNNSNTNLNKVESRYLLNSFIPHSMELSQYGEKVEVNRDENITIFKYNSRLLRVQVVEEGYHKIELINKNYSVMTEIEDLQVDGKFIREISNGNKSTYLEIDASTGKVTNKEYEIESDVIKPIDHEKVINLNILTFDIETYSDPNGKQIPYACGFSDGINTYKYYVLDFKSSAEDMLLKCINDMLVVKYKGYTVYVHNMGNFDSIFIYNLIQKHFTTTNLISIDSSIITFTVWGNKVDGKSRSKLIFRDSFRLLSQSLSSLGKAFDVEVNKGIFPYTFVNESRLEYKGKTPEFKFYNQDCRTKTLYDQEIDKNKVWVLRDETLDYLDKDLISLHQIMEKMAIEIFKSYRINITKYVTISALALALYRSNFMPEGAQLSIAKGEVEQCIREAFHGGSVDVIKPHGLDLYYYDCNGLYSAAMLYPMPVGNPIHTLNKNLNEIFGFVRATVTSPPLMEIGTLPYKESSDSGDAKSIYPAGTWTAWYYSEELKQNSSLFGYKVEVHESYIYQKGYNIFKDYVETIGHIKQSSTGARRAIHKLLLNSLFGRMGMRSDKDIIKIVTPDEAEKILLTHEVIENFTITAGKEYVRYKPYPDKELCDLSGINYDILSFEKQRGDKHVVSSIAIAAAVTAIGRMIMNPLKFLEDNPFYYGDTDSAILGKPLDPALIGDKIGQFKLEYPVIKEGYFISPKLYTLDTGSEFITKSKGYSGKLTLQDYKELYSGGVVNTMNERWKRNLKLSSVTIVDQSMRISSDFTKRNRLFSLGKWVATSPLCLGINGFISPTDLVFNPDTFLVPYTGSPIQHKLSLVKFDHIPPVAPPIIVFVPPYLISDLIYKPLPHNLKFLAKPKPLLALPIPDYIIIRVEPSLPEIIYHPGHRIIYLPHPIPEVVYSRPPTPSSCKSKYSKSVTVIDYTNNMATVYNSLGEASRGLNINISVISRRLKSGNKTLYKNRYLITSSITYSNLLT